MALPHPVLTVSGRPTAVIIADLSGRLVSGTIVPAAEVIDVREPATVVEQLDIIESRVAPTLTVNESTLAPRLVKQRQGADGPVDIRLTPSTYARFIAAANWISSLPVDEQVRELCHYSTGTPPWLSHSFGVNCTLETADGKLVWSRRPVDAIEGDRVTSAMSEGVHTGDIVNAAWDPLTTARRGFHEELGFAPDSTDAELRIELHSLIAQFGNGGVSSCGHATTSLTLDQVLRQHHDALDADEHANGLYVVDANAEAFCALLEAHPLSEWTTWGAVGAWHLLVNRFGIEHDDLRLQQLPTGAPV